MAVRGRHSRYALRNVCRPAGTKVRVAQAAAMAAHKAREAASGAIDVPWRAEHVT
jgi:hypothetical protein